MKNNKKTISISLDKNIHDKLEDDKINKSKLINFLMNRFFKNNEDLENFKRKSNN